ncbi:hypothetical protein PENTCL1PPCAC_3961, partial [Pristionchus entomophagus]
MIGAQYEFMPTMLLGPEYNCSSVMPQGQAWADKYGVKQIPFGVYSLVFGIITEILYIPCMIGLGRDLRSSCIKIMFWLALLDMVAIMANCVLFGVLLLEGAVFCSNPVMTVGVGIAGYGMWCTASACCLVLALNRLFEMLNLSRYFSVSSQVPTNMQLLFQSTRTNIYIGICSAYGLFMVLFTRTLQSMFFSPFIQGHNTDEYVNWPHAVHNMVVALCSCLLYMALCAVLMLKSVWL